MELFLAYHIVLIAIAAVASGMLTTLGLDTKTEGAFITGLILTILVIGGAFTTHGTYLKVQKQEKTIIELQQACIEAGVATTTIVINEGFKLLKGEADEH